MLETFGRYSCLARERSGLRCELGRARDCCLLLRFESLVPVIQQTMQALADIRAAVARTGARAHGGYLVLSCATSTVQRARPVPARLHSTLPARLHSTLDQQRTRCSPSRACRALAVSGRRGDGRCARRREPACVRVQILLEGARSYPARGARCLSAACAWQQLVPDIAALVRSLCVAVEAWPPGAPLPRGLETALEPGHMYTPLGLQLTVRPSQSVAPRVRTAHNPSQLVLARRQCLPA